MGDGWAPAKQVWPLSPHCCRPGGLELRTRNRFFRGCAARPHEIPCLRDAGAPVGGALVASQEFCHVLDMALFGAKTEAPKRPIDELLDFEQELHKRLNFVEHQSKRIATAPGIWRRHVTISEGDFEPIGRKTQALHVMKAFEARHWWMITSAVLGLALVIVIFIN